MPLRAARALITFPADFTDTSAFFSSNPMSLQTEPKKPPVALFFTAVASGKLKTVEKLLAQHPTLLESYSIHMQQTPIECAMSHDDDGMASLLISHGPKDADANERCLFWAVRKGNSDLVARIIAKWPELMKLGDIYSAFDLAVSCNNIGIVGQMLDRDHTLLNRSTSWRWAALYGFNDVLKLMLSHNPVSLIDVDGSSTALTEAASAKHETTVALLLDRRPELIQFISSDGTTALHHAVKTVSIVKQLLAHKPELIDMVDRRGTTALHFAAEAGSVAVIDFLLSQHPKLSDMLDSGGQNALHVAALRGHGEAFLRLLAQNPRSIDVTTTSTNRNTLHYAALGCDPKVLDATLSLRPELAFDVDSADDTPLHCLCQHGKGRTRELQNTLESFLEKIWKLNPNALQIVNKQSQTPLICASVLCDPRWGTTFFTRKLSWDEMFYSQLLTRLANDRSLLKSKVQDSLAFANKECEAALSSCLGIHALIEIVKEYCFCALEEDPELGDIFTFTRKRLRDCD